MYSIKIEPAGFIIESKNTPVIKGINPLARADIIPKIESWMTACL